MTNLISEALEHPGLPRLDVWIISLTPLARNGGQVVRSLEDFKTAHDVGSVPGFSPENAVVSPDTSVHQNVHQRIKKDRIGYIWIKRDMRAKCIIISRLHSDSDPLLRIRVDSIGYGRIIPD